VLPISDAETMFLRCSSLALPALVVASLVAAAPVADASTSPPKRAHIALLIRHSRVDHKCAGAGTPATAAPKPAMRTAVVCLINQQRSLHHLRSVRDHRDLDHSAQSWTNSMVASGQFTHGVNFADRITSAGFVWSSAGENIATGFQTPREVVRAWMASTDHCHNILDPTYSDVGTGVSAHPVGRFASGPSTWTQDFGLWTGHSAPSNNFGPSNGCPYQI
jgi:uncharacterized protein YkwD